MQRILPLAIALATGLVALPSSAFISTNGRLIFASRSRAAATPKSCSSALNQQFIRSHAPIFAFDSCSPTDARVRRQSHGRHSVDLAVVRSDIAMPTDASTVLILAHQYAVIAAPPGANYANVSDLKGKRVAIIRHRMSGDANQTHAGHHRGAIFAAARRHEQTARRDVADLAKLLQAGEVDAVLAFGRFDSPQLC